MSSGADLFIVCRHCGSEVSPYITECPYCGHRLRRRAPKLPRERDGAPGRPRPIASSFGSLTRRLGAESSQARPYATIALVAGACAVWVATSAGLLQEGSLALEGSLHGQWWRLLTFPFVYGSGVYAFVALLAIAVFGWLLERRHGFLLVVALFFGAGAAGALAAEAVYAEPVLSGGQAAALALLAAWAAQDLRAARRREWYEGDLLGTAAIAGVLVAMPFAIGRPGTSWLAGVVGGVVGLLVGMGISRLTSIAEL